MKISISMRMSFLCPHCNIRNPLPGLRTQLDCYSCTRSFDLVELSRKACVGGTRYNFGAYYDVLAEAVLLLKEGDPCRDNKSAGISERGTLLFRRMPQCASCQAPLPLDALAAAMGSTVLCACGERTPVRGADAETGAWDPRIAFVVGDGHGQGVELPAASVQSVAVPCGLCGAPMTPDATRRAARCSFCGVTTFLGDTVWRKLHPTPERHVLYLVYEVDRAQGA